MLYERLSDMVVEKTKKCVSRNVGDEVLILNTMNNAMFSLNVSGALVWKLIDINGDVRYIVEKVAEKYGLPSERAQQDVVRLIQMLEEQQLIQVHKCINNIG